MFRIDKSLVDNMNVNKSFIVITHKETLEAEKNKADSIKQVSPEIRDEADTILEKARAEAESIIQNAQNQTEELKNSAWETGYAKGMEDADRNASELLQAERAEFSSLLKEFTAAEQKFFNDIHDQVLQLSIDITEKILNIQLKRDDTVYVGIVNKAIERVKAKDNIVLRVNRAEYNRYFKENPEWMQNETDVPVEVVCDPYVEEWGCVLESEEGILNAGVGLQLEQIHYSLDEKVKQNG